MKSSHYLTLGYYLAILDSAGIGQPLFTLDHIGQNGKTKGFGLKCFQKVGTVLAMHMRHERNNKQRKPENDKD